MKRRIASNFSRRAVAPAILLALFATALAVGCSKAPEDSAIRSAIQSSYYADPSLKATNLQVVVTKGQVMLAGEVPSAELKDRAEQMAKATKGVTSVEDRISVAAPAAQQAAAPAPVMERPEAPKPKRIARAPRRVRPTPAPAPVAEPTPTQPPAATEAAAPPPEPAPPVQPPAPQPVQITIPSGTHLSVRMIDAVDSSKASVGDVFRASLDEPIVVDGQPVVPRGADISIRLARAKAAGRMTGSTELELQLVKMVTGGQSYALVSNSYTAKGKSRGKDTATKWEPARRSAP